MYQFPYQFASTSVQIALLTIENMPEFVEASEDDLKEILEAEMGPTAMAFVRLD